MKILAVSTWFPFPPDNGSRARTYHLLRGLASNHTVDLLALSQSHHDIAQLSHIKQFFRRVQMFPEPRFIPSDPRSIIAFFSVMPRYFRIHHCPQMESAVRHWLADETYDATLAITLGAAPYVARLDVPFRVLDEHNVESQVIRRQLANATSALRRLRLLGTCMKSEMFERNLASSFDAIAVVSDSERTLMQNVLRNGSLATIHVVPNGVQPELLEYRNQTRERDVIVFTGSVTYQPNMDAAMRLAFGIVPILQRAIPRLRVRVTGGYDGVNIERLAAVPGVEFTGYVADIRPMVASALALVVPLRYGGGTRVKILEAMALGTPVVSTAVGAEGLDVTDGENILLGESDEELAQHTLRLYLDPALAERISLNARRLVAERYCWPTIAREFESIFTGAVDRRLS